MSSLKYIARVALAAVCLCASSAGAADRNGPGEIEMNFRGASLDEVLEHLSMAAGLIIVRDAEIEATIDIISHQPMTRDEAVDLLNTVLNEKGYTAIRNDRTLRIVLRDEARTQNLPVHTGNDPEAVPNKDEMVHQIIPIKNTDAEELLEDIQPLLADYSTVTANQSSNAIIMTDTLSNVRRIMQIIQALDMPISGTVEVRVFALRYAEAEDTADMVNEIFDVDNQRSGGNNNRGGGGGGGGSTSSFFDRIRQSGGFSGFSSRGGDRGGGDRGGGGKGGGGKGGGQDGARTAVIEVVAVGDERTNSVVVSAEAGLMDTIAEVILELDSNPVEDQTVFVYPLANADAANLATILNELIEQVSSTVTGAGGGDTGGRGGGFGGRGGGGGGQNNSSGSGLEGNVYVVADEDTNSLLVLTDQENFERMREIILELDRALPQALIKVLIAEVTHTNDLDIGAEFRWIDNLGVPDRQDIVGTDFGLAAQTSGMVVQILDDDLAITLRAIQEAGKLEILSRPSILAVNNQEANITVGLQVPFITNTRITQDGQTLNDVEYRPIGIILDITPHINVDGVVTLDVAPVISALTGETIQLNENFFAPTIAERSASTRVVVPDGETIVIGGMMEDQNTELVRKVPLLGDIPWLGKLFQRKTTQRSKTELLIFLTPHVVQQYDRIGELASIERGQLELLPGAIEDNRFDRHLYEMQQGGLGTRPWIPK